MSRFVAFGEPDFGVDFEEVIQRFDNEADLEGYIPVDVSPAVLKKSSIPITHVHSVLDDNNNEYFVILNISELSVKQAVEEHDLEKEYYLKGGYKVDAFVNNEYLTTHYYSKDNKSSFNLKNTEGIAYEFFGDYMFMMHKQDNTYSSKNVDAEKETQRIRAPRM